MTRRVVWSVLVVVAGLPTVAVPQGNPANESAQYAREIKAFQEAREASLRAEDGWLSVSGLVWLKPGANRIGGDPTSEVPLRAGAPHAVGVLTLGPDDPKAGTVGVATFEPAPGVTVASNGQPFAGGAIRSDADGGKADVLAVGDFRLILLRRNNRFALRLKDNQAPTRTQFAGTRWFATDEHWRLVARFTPHPLPKTITFATIVGGTDVMPCPGTVSFEQDGVTHTLEAAAEPDGKLWFVFRDATAGTETAGNARQLTTAAPVGNSVVLDFNKAINLPCAYIEFATCPTAPPQNRLSIAVPAGEKTPQPRPAPREN